mgnify:FL=1
MRLSHGHVLSVGVAEARKIQERMRPEVREGPPLDTSRIKRVVGMDIS